MFFLQLRSYRIRTSILPAAILAFCILCLATVALQARQSANRANHFRGHVIRVEAGDRIVARLQTLDFVVRLHGVTSPTSPPAARDRALEYTKRRVLDEDVDVAVRGTAANQTIYGEVVGEDGDSLNQELVRIGLATWASTYAPSRTDLRALQVRARAERLGIWSDPTASNVVLPTPKPKSTPTRVAAAPRPTPKPSRTPIARVLSIPTPAPRTPLPPEPTTAAPTPTPAQPNLTTIPAIPSPTPWRAETKVRLHPQRTVARVLPAAVNRPRPVAPPGKTARSNDPRLGLVVIFAGLTIALTAASFAAQGTSRGRLPFQVAIAALAAASVTLMLPVFSGTVAAADSASGAGIVAVLTPALICCGWAAMSLPRREQILRGASQKTVHELATAEGTSASAGSDFVRVSGYAFTMPEGDALVSRVGAIPATYYHEVTQIYQASDHTASQPQRNRRYSWHTISNDRRTADFLLGDGGAESAKVVVEAERAEFYAGQVARFYNEVPVEQWFARPYPGDTRTEITFVARDSPIVVWGRARRVESSDGAERTHVGFDGVRGILVIAAGDGSVVWTRRPLVGLLLTLCTICLGVALAFAFATVAPQAPSRGTVAIGPVAAIVSFWVGAFVLVALIRSASAAFAADSELRRYLKLLEACLEPRRERVFALFSRDDSLIEAARRAESERTLRDRFLAESEIDARLRSFTAGGPMPLGPAARAEDVRRELRQLQLVVAAAAARYNALYRAVAFLRLKFPAGLFLRARDVDSPAPYGKD